MDPTWLMHGAALAIAAVAAVTDHRTGHIPNGVTLPALILGPLAHGFLHGPLGFGLSLVAIVLCGLVPYLLFKKDAIGGGDVKLLAAIGALTGPSIGIEAQLVAFLVAMVYALACLAYRGTLLRSLGRALRLGVNPLLPARMRREVPAELMLAVRLGPAIFLGTIFAVVSRYGLLFA